MRRRWTVLPLVAATLHAGPMPDPEFIDNGVIRLGIDRSAGVRFSISVRPGKMPRTC